MTMHSTSRNYRSNNSLPRLSGAKGESCGSNQEHNHGGPRGVPPLSLLPRPPPPPLLLSPPPLLLPPPFLSRPTGLFLPLHVPILPHRQSSPRSLVQKRKAMLLLSLGPFGRQRRARNRTNKTPSRPRQPRQRQTTSNISCMITLLWPL